MKARVKSRFVIESKNLKVKQRMGELLSLQRTKRAIALALACALSTSPLTAVAAPAGTGGAKAPAGEEMLAEGSIDCPGCGETLEFDLQDEDGET